MSTDPQTLRRLAYVKGVFLHGLQLLGSGSELDTGMAVVAFDNAIEMAMYVCLEFAGVPFPEHARFDDLFEQLKPVIRSKVPDKDPDRLLRRVEARNLHRSRNGVQHHGIIPSRGDSDRYSLFVASMISDLFQVIFSIKFEEVSLSLLIRDPISKKLYQSGESAYAGKQYVDSILFSAAAFEYSKFQEQGRLYGSGLSAATLKAQGFLKSESALKEYVDKVAEEVEVLKLRLDYKKYQMFREIFQYGIGPSSVITLPPDEKEIESEIRAKFEPAIRSHPQGDIQNYALFCLGFVIESILKWEAVPRKTWFEMIPSVMDYLFKSLSSVGSNR